VSKKGERLSGGIRGRPTATVELTEEPPGGPPPPPGLVPVVELPVETAPDVLFDEALSVEVEEERV